MKNKLKLILIALLFVFAPSISMALEFRAGEQVSIKKSEIISNDIYMAGASVSSDGEITGDLIAGGGDILVSGDVSGDAILGGGTVTILSNIGDDARIGGGTILVRGKIGGDLIIGGGQVNVGGSGIGGDLVVGGGNVSIDAPVAGKLIIGGGNVYINSSIRGDVSIQSDKVTLGSNAVISGNITYKSKIELTKEDGAVVKGKINFEPRKVKKISPVVFSSFISGFILWKFLTLLVCSLIIGTIFKRYSKEITSIAKKQPLFELGRGIIFLAAMPVISVLLFFTIVGTPFGILGLIGFVAIMIFAWILAPIILGNIAYGYIFKKETESTWKTILLGVFLCTLLSLVPFIGWLAQAILIFITLGSITAFKLQIIKEWR